MADYPSMGYAVTRDGTHLVFRAIGQGPPDLVLLPFWTSSIELDVDDLFIGPTLRRAASVGRLVSYDKAGTGMSDPVAPGASPTLEERVDEVSAVLDAVGCERGSVIAGADGAAIAIMFAAMYPDRVSSLCLYAPWARLTWAPDYPIGYPAEVLDMLVGLIGQTWGTGEVAALAPSVAADERFKEWFGRYQRMSASPAAAMRFFRTAIDTDVREVLRTLSVPTLVIHRRGDQVVPMAFGRYVADHIPGARFIELEGDDHLWAVGDSEKVVAAIEEFVTGTPPVADADRVLATVMFTDIVGSTELASELGDRRWRELLDVHDATVRRHLDRFRGREVKTTGDGVLAIFDGPGRAIRCACAIRDSVRVLGIKVRAGLHTGEIEMRADDVAGLAVHIAARVSAAAQAGEVLVSGAIPPLVAGSGLRFGDRGEHRLKGVPDKWNLYAVQE